ncbi:MAG: hypothetical protein AB2L12_10715 [Smithellaceae bacterium]
MNVGTALVVCRRGAGRDRYAQHNAITGASRDAPVGIMAVLIVVNDRNK